MLLASGLRQSVACNSIFQASELLICIAAEGGNRTLRQEDAPVIDHLPAEIGEVKVMLRSASKHLNCVWVAVKEQRNELVKGVNRGIGCIVDKLIEGRKPEDIARAVRSAAANVNIGSLDIRTVGIAAAERQENDALAEVRIRSEEIVFLGFDQRFDLLDCYMSSLLIIQKTHELFVRRRFRFVRFVLYYKSDFVFEYIPAIPHVTSPIKTVP